MKVILVIFVICFLIQNGNCAMTEAQVKAAVRLIKNTCIPKAKVTEAQVIAMHEGNWNLDKPAMCYLYCVLNYYKFLKPDNTFNWEDGIKMIQTQAPPSMATDIVNSFMNCKDAAKTTSDKCVAASEIAKCLYDFNPEKYFLP